MLHSSTKKLIDRLAEMTELGKLDWTEGDDGNVIYSTEGYSVHLPASADEVLITSIEGKELERAAAEALSVSHNEDGTSYSDIVAAMTKEATRIALGTEVAISTLLAGMEEPAAPEPEPEVAVGEPEDVINETTALAEETPVLEEAEAPAEADLELDAEPAVEAIDAAASEDEVSLTEEETTLPVTASEAGEDVTEEPEDHSEPIAAFVVTNDDESETEETSTEASDAPDAMAHDIAPTESESELTEAVARLADEVNGREESDIGAAAASAVGAVALAAGLTQEGEEAADGETEASTEEPAVEVETAEPEPAESAITAAEPISSVTYIPFGTEEVETEPAPVIADAEPETTPSEEPLTAAPTTAETGDEPAEIEAEPETAEIIAPSFVSVAASLEAEEPAETPSFATFSSETAAETAPMETVAAAPDTIESMDPTSETAPEVALAPAPEPEEPPQSYSLSGIGAGFGLGALAAKTEASGIPGPSDPMSDQEKIVIDATDDVLPEPEGKSNFSTFQSSGNGISFGTSETAESTDETDAEADEETDILKPRTRFNPWD